jgi:hypothetical protein
MTNFLAFMFIVMVLTGAVGVVCDLQWLAYLKRNHRGVWEELKSPAIRPYASLDEYRRLRAFIKDGGPQRTGDAQFCRLTRRRQTVTRLYLVIFAVLVISAAAFFTGLWSWTLANLR